MYLKKKNQHNNEIDLIDVFLTVWKYKWKISLFIIFPMVGMFLYIISQPSSKLTYVATTEIKPISIFEEFEYENYNSYLQNTNYENTFFLFNPLKENVEKLTNKKAFIFKDIDFYNNTDNSSFKKIDKEYLLNLFVDKLNENLIFVNAIKKFELVKRENYENNQSFENALTKLSSSIKINSEKNEDGKLLSLNIEFTTEDKEVWEKILLFIEDSTNQAVQNYLYETFNRLILNQKRLRKYKIEDIDILISNAQNKNKEMYISHLETLKDDISQNRNIDRLQDEFTSTPIVRAEKFYAARLLVKSTSYKNSTSKKYRMLPMLIVVGIIGAIIGIFYALMLNSVRSRN